MACLFLLSSQSSLFYEQIFSYQQQGFLWSQPRLKEKNERKRSIEEKQKNIEKEEKRERERERDERFAGCERDTLARKKIGRKMIICCRDNERKLRTRISRKDGKREP